MTQALIKEGANVIVISRPESSSGKNLPEGIKVLAIDFGDLPALRAAIKEHKIEVVISTVGPAALDRQTILGDAAKQGGAKLFIPSEFGFDTIGATQGLLAVKDQLAVHLKSIGLPSIRIFVSKLALRTLR